MNYSGKQAPSTFTWVWINRISMFPKQKDHSWVFLLSKTNCIVNAVLMSWRLQMKADTVIAHFITVNNNNKNSSVYSGLQTPCLSMYTEEMNSLTCHVFLLSSCPLLRTIRDSLLKAGLGQNLAPVAGILWCQFLHSWCVQLDLPPTPPQSSSDTNWRCQCPGQWFGLCDQLCLAVLVPRPWQLIGCLIIIIPSM